METMTDCSRTCRWYVVQTKPKNERRAIFHLGRAGIETLNPLIESYRPCTVAAGKVLEPLFPGYFFARFDVTTHYSTVRWARGVRRVLGNRDGPTAVGEEVIDEIRRRIDERGVARKPYELKPADPVRIRIGP
ncbi:MAG: hypothetical protein JRJ26_17300, partial [Deltaproteobacteria bacterium]|nr:hypothetical protein [Deltaproteobacteria bacterium]